MFNIKNIIVYIYLPLFFFFLVASPVYGDIEADIILAVKRGDSVSVQVLLEAERASANVRDEDGYTLIMLAIMVCSFDTVRTLVAKGANVNAKNIKGHTVLMIARRYGQRDVVDFLKKAGAKD